jgi:hypothetical protein
MEKKRTIKRQRPAADEWLQEMERAKAPFDWFMARLIGMQLLSNSPPSVKRRCQPQRLAQRMRTLAEFARLVGAAADKETLTLVEADAAWDHWRGQFQQALAEHPDR